MQPPENARHRFCLICSAGLNFGRNSTSMYQSPPQTIFDYSLADEQLPAEPVTRQEAEAVFTYFKDSPLFRWSDANNDCEDRANAICILLHAWGYPYYKAWVFSGAFRQRDWGDLTNCWNYHVAALLPVQLEQELIFYVIDPATSPSLVPIDQWALQITASGTSYHFIKKGDVYIFPPATILRDNWYRWNKRNFNWTMQGLSGINGVSQRGRAQLAFNKQRVERTLRAFRKIRCERPLPPPAQSNQ